MESNDITVEFTMGEPGDAEDVDDARFGFTREFHAECDARRRRAKRAREGR